MSIVKRNLKSFNIKPSNRSSDFIAPSFGTGCLLECSYCYMKRNTPEGLTIYNNVDDILIAIDKHSHRCNIQVSTELSRPQDNILHLQLQDHLHPKIKYLTFPICCQRFCQVG